MRRGSRLATGSLSGDTLYPVEITRTASPWPDAGPGRSHESVVLAPGEPLSDATDLPFVPYFLGLLARFWDDPLFVALVKNPVFQSLPAYVFVRLWSRGAHGWLTPPRRALSAMWTIW